MPRYQMHFETQAGWIDYGVDIDEEETLHSVLPDILHELEHEGYALQGWEEGHGEVVVTAEGRALDAGQPLPQQGVSPRDKLRVVVTAPRPELQLRRHNETCDMNIVDKEELYEDDEIIVGRTILRFHLTKQHSRPSQHTTFLQRFQGGLQQSQSFQQTVYYMALVGGMAGLGCWFVVSWLPDLMTIGGGMMDVINVAVLGGFIGGLTVGFHDHWLEDGVVGRWVLVGIGVGIVAGVIGGLLHAAIGQTQLAERSPWLARAMAWMLAGLLIGAGISLRWLSVNTHRVLYGLIGGMAGGMLGGMVFWGLRGVIGEGAQALGFVLTGLGITWGVSLAPILWRQGMLEFVTSGDRGVMEKYGRSRKQWELHDGGRYCIGSLSARETRTIFLPEVHIFIPDKRVVPRHAILTASTGRYYLEPHPELRACLAQPAFGLQESRSSSNI
jgi:hypothetical protein